MQRIKAAIHSGSDWTLNVMNKILVTGGAGFVGKAELLNLKDSITR